jgi:hypothetical protein
MQSPKLPTKNIPRPGAVSPKVERIRSEETVAGNLRNSRAFVKCENCQRICYAENTILMESTKTRICTTKCMTFQGVKFPYPLGEPSYCVKCGQFGQVFELEDGKLCCHSHTFGKKKEEGQPCTNSVVKAC